jgi:hypothetical protein
LACEGGGGSDATPTDTCNDYCDRLLQCGWYLPGYGNPCNKNLCEGVVAFFEHEDESCDEAAVAYFKCGTKASCVSLEFEPCQRQFDKMVRECPFAFTATAEGSAAKAQVAE